MIPSARPTVTTNRGHYFQATFVLRYFKKWARTDVRTDVRTETCAKTGGRVDQLNAIKYIPRSSLAFHEFIVINFPRIGSENDTQTRINGFSFTTAHVKHSVGNKIHRTAFPADSNFQTHSEGVDKFMHDSATTANKTGVISDPLGQTHSPAGRKVLSCFVWFWKVGKDCVGRTTCVNIVITTGLLDQQ